jgi:hypothetical protein
MPEPQKNIRELLPPPNHRPNLPKRNPSEFTRFSHSDALTLFWLSRFNATSNPSQKKITWGGSPFLKN